MPCSLYICLQDEDKIVTFDVDTDTSRLTPQLETPVAGGPSVLAISPDQRMLYVGHRTQRAISSFRIDQGTGQLTPQGTVTTGDAPTFLPPTAPADTCCPPIIRAGMRRSTRSKMAAQ
jgi:6-phosphogluconolactonase (cycloisomerase 2 family)